MNKLLLGVALLALSAGAARAQSYESSGSTGGIDNHSYVLQKGGDCGVTPCSGGHNYALNAQFGVLNKNHDVQIGERNINATFQYGDSNLAFNYQRGSFNIATEWQVGARNVSVIAQHGVRNWATHVQFGYGNVAASFQGGITPRRP